MNAAYNQTSAADAARIFGVAPQTVTLWCRNKIIKYQDISEAGSKKARYVIPDNEVDRVHALIQKYGKRNWMFSNNDEEPQTREEEEVMSNSTETRYESKADEIARTIIYIQDIKERLEDLEAERNQLVNELETMRNEVLAYIE